MADSALRDLEPLRKSSDEFQRLQYLLQVCAALGMVHCVPWAGLCFLQGLQLAMQASADAHFLYTAYPCDG